MSSFFSHLFFVFSGRFTGTFFASNGRRQDKSIQRPAPEHTHAGDTSPTAASWLYFDFQTPATAKKFRTHEKTCPSGAADTNGSVSVTVKKVRRLGGVRKTVKPTYGYDHRSVFM